MKDILPDSLRKTLYVVYAFIGVAIGAVQVGFSAGDIAQPQWLTIGLAVYAFLGTAFGFVASSNIHSTRPDPDDDGIGI